jgi:hypothetical protein
MCDMEKKEGIYLSDVIIQNPQVTSFSGLLELVAGLADTDTRFLHLDIKPDFPDTPRGWELKVEGAFYWGNKVR